MLGHCPGPRPCGTPCSLGSCRALPFPARQTLVGRRLVLVARRQALVTRAGPGLVKLLHTGAGLGILAGIAASSLPILSGESRKLNERRYLQPTEEEVAESIRWGVMSVISVIPYLSPLAWVFGALDDEENASLYFAYAALYTAPYLTSGFRLDSFALLALTAGIAHVQIERIAQTEPVELSAPEGVARTLRQASRGVQTCVRACAAYVRGRREHASSGVARELTRDESAGTQKRGTRHAPGDETWAEDRLPLPPDEEQEDADSPADGR